MSKVKQILEEDMRKWGNGVGFLPEVTDTEALAHYICMVRANLTRRLDTLHTQTEVDYE